ncbi:unnamed protein product [Jaminaea pallidilutea]
MANPRQRRKARSGVNTGPSQTAKRHIRKKAVRAPTVKGPDILKEGWDPKKTVRQNYEALGLTTDLKMRPSGGLDPESRDERNRRAALASSSVAADNDDNPAAESSDGPTKGMGRIIRDEEGNVIDVVLDDDENAPEVTPWGETMAGWEDERPAASKGSKRLGGGESSVVVEKLEKMPNAGPLLRHVSELEAGWLLSLVRKHGDDVDAMFMDKKLNELQKTKGEIRSRIKRAGGFDTLKEAIAVQDGRE